MAAHERKTGSADTGGSAYESSIEEREAAYGDEEVNDPSDETADAIDGVAEAAAADASAADWGFTEKRSRFSREVIIGGFAVTLLVAVFCAIVMKNFEGDPDSQTAEAALRQPESGLPPESSLGEAGAIPENDPFLPPAGQLSQDSSANEPLDLNGEQLEPVAQAVPLMTGPSEVLADPAGDPFATIGNRQNASADPFSQPTGLSQQEPLVASEPFDAGPLPDRAAMPEPAFPETPVIEPELAGSEPLANEPFLTNEPTTLVEPALPLANDDLLSGRLDSGIGGPDISLVNEPLESTTTVFATDPAESPAGWANTGEYVVQNNESFWTISKKVYGTVRYFEVLAELNRQVAPDRDRLKPGTRIQTPDMNVMESLLTDLKSRSRTTLKSQPGILQPMDVSDSATGDVLMASSSGFFHSQQGYPMFRVGDTDTLTTIAAEHLGRASRWQQIYRMNSDLLAEPEALRPGMELKLPADASRKRLVDRGREFR